MAAKEKKGLGTGLGVLFGADEFDDEAEQLTLPISKVEPRSEQPREYFDQEALEALADSIRQYGLIQPITVRKLDSGYYQIIAGERRWRASRLAGLTEVPVRVIEADDRRTAELALVENLQREDLNPIEEAKGYKLLIEEYGLTQEDAARSVGRSRPAVTNAMRLLMLTPPVMAFNAIAAPERLAEVGHILGVPRDPAKTIYEQAYQAAEAFRALMQQLDLPLTLTELGTRGLARPAITEADLDTLTADAMLARGMRGRNPRVNGERDIRVLYASVL